MKKLTIEQVRQQADKEMKLSDLKNLAFVIAEKMIRYQGYYSFINSDTNEKIFVTK